MAKLVVIDSDDNELYKNSIGATWSLPNKSDVIVINDVCYSILNIYHALKDKTVTIYVTKDV